MPSITVTVTVEYEREQGKFVSNDTLREHVEQAVLDGGFDFDDGESAYTAASVDVTTGGYKLG